MPSRKFMSDDDFRGLVTSVKQLIDPIHGEKVPGVRLNVRPKPLDSIEVRNIRKSLGLTQDRFAVVVGEGLASIQSWEQGVRRPNGSASKLMRLLESHPELAVELARA